MVNTCCNSISEERSEQSQGIKYVVRGGEDMAKVTKRNNKREKNRSDSNPVKCSYNKEEFSVTMCLTNLKNIRKEL